MKRSNLRPLVAALLVAGATMAAQAARIVTEVVTAEPPAPVVETVGVAPHPGWAWHPGYYNWVDHRYVWVNGEWAAPRVGYRWQPHAWVKEGGGWRLHEGVWVRG